MKSINSDSEIRFRCNICGEENIGISRNFHREIPNCQSCNSTPRFRGIIHGLSLGLFGRSIPLHELPENKNLRGVGMSEWETYANVLAQKYDFVNTFYHMEPRLDITGDDWARFSNLDFVICTEVFEHILAPLDVAFSNLRRMIRPGGVLVFSTPYTSACETTEHFPGLRDFATCQIGDRWVVVSRTDDGTYRVFDRNVHFHGGPGTVLEMRVFGEQDLMRQLREAGFIPTALSEPAPEIGYYWPQVVERAELVYPSLNYIILARAV